MRTLAALALIIVVGGACTNSTPTAATSPHSHPSPTSTALAPQQLCFTDAPADWATAMSTLVATLDGVNFGAAAVDEQHGVAYGGVWMASQDVIAAVDLSTGKMTPVAPMSSSGFAWMSYGDGWLAWPQPDPRWTIQLWNGRTHERREIVTDAPAQGVVGHGYVAWSESIDDNSSELRMYQLASGKVTTLDSGQVGPPVFAGNYMVWTKRAAGAAHPSFVFADATTLQPAVVPAELREAREIGSLAGSADRLIWTGTPASSSPNNGTWFVDDLAADTLTTFGARNHYFQFPELAGPYLVWFGADKNSVVDLRTGNGFDIPLPSGVEIAGNTLVVVRVTTLGGVDRSDVAVLHPSQLSPLTGC